MPNGPKDNLFSLGWGTPDEQNIGRPLEATGQYLLGVQRKIGKGIRSGLDQIETTLAGVHGQLAGQIAAVCQECQVCLSAADRMISESIEDKLLAVRYCLDEVCDKCPEVNAAVWGHITGILPDGSNPSLPPNSLPTTPPASYTASLPQRPSGGQSISLPGGTLTTEPPQFSPTAAVPNVAPTQPIQPVVTGVAGAGGTIPQTQTAPQSQTKPPATEPPMVGQPAGFPTGQLPCIWCHPATNHKFISDSNDAAAIAGGYKRVACSYDIARLQGQMAFVSCSIGQPPQPPVVPTPPTQPQQCTQCIVCGQQQPTDKPCPECPKPEFCAWSRQDGSLCYVLPKDRPPLQTGDIKLDCSTDLAVLASLIQNTCSGKPTSPDSGEPSNIAVGLDSNLCHLLAYEYDKLTSGILSERIIGPLLNLLIGDQGRFDKLFEQARQESKSLNPITSFWGAIKGTVLVGLRNFDRTFMDSLQKSGCVDSKFIDAVGGLSIMQFLEKWIAGDLPWITTPLKYAANSVCPVLFPSADAATEAFIRGEIDQQTLNLWIRQNGYCNEPWQRIIWSRQSRLSPLESTAAIRRGLITEDQYKQAIRANGFLSSNAPDLFLGLTQPIPPITDLVRFMVRDVEDTGIINRFKLDTGFSDKWKGQAKAWGEQQGITDEIALRYWRAHWSIPSPTQLFEMFHRSRGADPSDPSYVDLDTIKEALVYQDVAPFWIDKLLNTTYSLLRLVDIRRAYELGALDLDGVYQQLVKRGYSDRDAEVIARFYERDKQQKLLRSLPVRMYERGELTRAEMESRLLDRGAIAETIEQAVIDAQPKLLSSKPVKLFQQWQITEAELRNELSTLGALPDTIEKALRLGRRVRFKAHRMRCLSALRKRYILGEFDRVTIADALVNAGASSEEANELIPLWDCEKASRGKFFTASQMCQYVEHGLLSPLQMFERLTKVGWSDDDAYTIVAHCGSKLGAKAEKELARLDKEREKQAEKARKAIERAEKERQRKLDQQNARLKRLDEQRQSREQRVETAIQELVKLTGESYDLVGSEIRKVWADIRRLYSLAPNEQVHVISVAILRGKPDTIQAATDMIMELADQAEQLASVSDGFAEPPRLE